MDEQVTFPPLAKIFRVEVKAARLEGALRADAKLAAMWRAEAAVVEACASAWIEDLPVTAEEVLCRTYEGIGDPERDRAAVMAAAYLRVLHSPGDILHDPTALDRIWSLGARGQGACPFAEGDRQEVYAAIRQADSPIIGAITAAQIVHRITGGEGPAVERLVFVAVDHALRGSGRFMLGEVDPHDLVAAPRGQWVVQPSAALVDGGFRLWSLGSTDRIEELLIGLERKLDAAIGALSVYRRWLDRASDVAQHAHGASKLPLLVDHIALHPIVSTPEIARDLGITQRGALKLVDTAVEVGLLRLITPRASYRIWATEPFAQVLR